MNWFLILIALALFPIPFIYLEILYRIFALDTFFHADDFKNWEMSLFMCLLMWTPCGILMIGSLIISFIQERKEEKEKFLGAL